MNTIRVRIKVGGQYKDLHIAVQQEGEARKQVKVLQREVRNDLKAKIGSYRTSVDHHSNKSLQPT